MRRAIVWTLGLGMLLSAACSAEMHPTEQPSPTPTYTPSATSEIVPSPTVTKEPTVTPTPELTPTTTAEKPTPTREPTPEKPQEYLIIQQIDAYESADEASRAGYIIPGKHFTVLEEKDSWLYVKVFQPGTEGAWNWWIKASETAYWPADKPLPTPTPKPEVPHVVCEAPYWPGRTPDRETGITFFDGEAGQLIKPEGISTPPHYQWMQPKWYPELGKFTKRDGRIIEIGYDPQKLDTTLLWT